MDNNSNSYFYLGGFVSFLILLLVFALFSYTLLTVQTTKSYALTKDKAINISLVMDVAKKNTEKKIEQETAVEKKEIVEPTETKEIKTETKIIEKKDVSSLFSSVVTKSFDKKKVDDTPKVDEKKLLQLTQKTNMVSKNNVSSIKQKIDDTKFSKANVQVTSQSGSSGEEVNKYLAKIQGHIYDNFFPPLNTQGQIAKVMIKLGADGTVLDFRILSYSSNEFFNAEVDRLNNRVFRIKFPQNPDSKSGNYMITLVAKE
jgi:protein TonB